jgi:hypothetical protein
MTRSDILALAFAAIVTAGLAAFTILPGSYPPRAPLGDVPGTVEAYALRVTKLGGTRGLLRVRLDRGEAIKVQDTGGQIPANRVCIRAVKRGDLIEGYVVDMSRCQTP